MEEQARAATASVASFQHALFGEEAVEGYLENGGGNLIESPKSMFGYRLDPQVRAFMQRHRDERKLWMPSELLPSGEGTETELAAMRERARGLPDGIRVALALNLLTEEGLPHFHRLVAQYMGHDGVWSEWNNLWTAEEDRHGCVLRDYVRDARVFDMVAL